MFGSLKPAPLGAQWAWDHCPEGRRYTLCIGPHVENRRMKAAAASMFHKRGFSKMTQVDGTPTASIRVYIHGPCLGQGA